MKLRKTIKKIIIALSIITITACTSSKIFNRYQKKDADNVDTNIIRSSDGRTNFFNKEQYIQIQHLQQNNTVYFDLNKYNIRPEFMEMLNIHSNFLIKNPLCKVIIEGHTDERGTPEYNIALGERRANEIKIYLQSRGVYSEQISVISYGKEKPAVLGHNESAYEKNRRAMLVYQENYSR